MKKLKFTLITAALMLTGLIVSARAQTTYWLGARDGNELRFDVQIPADAVKVILNQTKAPGGGADTTPHYKAFTYTIEGKIVRFHSNELGWETPKLKEGSLSWKVDAGIGEDWRTCNTKDPLWKDFADALAELATSSGGWSTAKVFMAEGSGKTPPTARLNIDGSFGAMSAEKKAIQQLADMNSKSSLTEDELEEVRELMLAIANAGRANPNYRREAGSKTALDLPAGLKPLEMNDIYNKAAQFQAEYCARTKQVTHDHEDEKYATVELRMKAFGYKQGAAEAAGAGSLQEYPTGWMKSETHYRPWWNLDGEISTLVGFGIAKADDGTWYFVAVIGT